MKKYLLNILIRVNSFISHIIALGYQDGLKVYFFNGQKDGLLQLKLRKFPVPAYLRGNTSDFAVFKQIFFAKEYDINFGIQPISILDCGANIGLASFYFKLKYPNAKIITVEPEQSNFELTKKNTASFKDMYYEQAGIWKQDAFLKISAGPLNEHWDFVVSETTEDDKNAIKGLSIPSIMKKYNLDEISVLKIDIEGSEKELFETGYEEWLPKVKILIVELHDRMKPGCSKAFYKAISNYDFDFTHSGENIIATRR